MINIHEDNLEVFKNINFLGVDYKCVACILMEVNFSIKYKLIEFEDVLS
jgi:hypothetical protein